MLRRCCTILLATMMLCTLLYGCTGADGGKAQTSTADSVGTTNAKTTAQVTTKATTQQTTQAPAASNFHETRYPIVEEKVTLTSMHQFSPSNGEFNDMVYFMKMEEVTNVHMDFLPIPSTDWETKKNLTLAGGDLPHWFYHGLSMNDKQKYGVEGGMFVYTTPLMEQYMPNFVETLKIYPRAKNVITMSNGAVYCFPYIADDATMANDTLYLRMDLLRKAGVEKKPSTIDEFYDMLVALKEANFSEDFAPLLPRGSMNPVEGFLFPSFGEGWDPGFADNGDGKVVFNTISEQYRLYLEFVHI